MIGRHCDLDTPCCTEWELSQQHCLPDICDIGFVGKRFRITVLSCGCGYCPCCFVLIVISGFISLLGMQIWGLTLCYTMLPENVFFWFTKWKALTTSVPIVKCVMVHIRFPFYMVIDCFKN